VPKIKSRSLEQPKSDPIKEMANLDGETGFPVTQTKLASKRQQSGDKLKDTEETSLPPIEHVEAHRDVVEVDLLAHPVHLTHLLLAAE
jgi:hypothetical protein